MEVLQSCQRVAENVQGGVIADAGHWVPEEQPQILAQQLLAFFSR
jgi:pimeloyl-ACP methyl ester carboxylesterase